MPLFFSVAFAAIFLMAFCYFSLLVEDSARTERNGAGTERKSRSEAQLKKKAVPFPVPSQAPAPGPRPQPQASAPGPSPSPGPQPVHLRKHMRKNEKQKWRQGGPATIILECISKKRKGSQKRFRKVFEISKFRKVYETKTF